MQKLTRHEVAQNQWFEMKGQHAENVCNNGPTFPKEAQYFEKHAQYIPEMAKPKVLKYSGAQFLACFQQGTKHERRIP